MEKQKVYELGKKIKIKEDDGKHHTKLKGVY